MKAGILSDIHVDINSPGKTDHVTPAIADFVNSLYLDFFILAGDIASDYKLSLKVIRELETRTGIPFLFVPGNHDIWTENYQSKTSWEIYEELKNHPRNLSSSPFRLKDNWVVIGDMGWYDYHFGSGKYTEKDFNKMKYEKRVWQDSIKAKWDRSTIEMNNFFLQKIEERIQTHQDKNIILVTHVLPIKEFTVQNPSPMWEYMNAFMGSPEYGEIALKYTNVKYSISGHVHYRKEIKKSGTTFICNCLGYSTEWEGTTDPYVEVPRAVKVINME